MSNSHHAVTANTPIALTIAGSDSGAGAGIQADLKTFAACGVYGTSALTAITAQNTQGVQGLWQVPIDSLKAQITSVLSDMPVAAVKTGLLGSAEAIRQICQVLDGERALSLVVDPVMVASSGHRFLSPDALGALREQLIPRASVITPNTHEAARLLGEPEAHTLTAMQAQAERLLMLGAQAVLITGGHLGGAQAVDVYCDTAGLQLFARERIATENNHGTGCTLSAAITAYLARGEPLPEACRLAKHYLHRALLAGANLKVGAGCGPLNHFPEKLQLCSTQEPL
ncbi:bifunctional hydroxymethylpyrimidine kinase/phosphomethylpyrimidine kinase [Gilvimarinus agarilyticus]|uniref:bifunctional hydroxymethylpyrimidine kinase/phosphomethylpyrimidine kinase n=1 Tax=unclassified Gilvimarinus TaxID=2642066 RepID=UPI001C080B2D|nr:MULTISPECIES: bifunctional hydroxymethylpyrimidine kinase/phosphomethylpyrimidine kinase [unclassified Gilvimarinus]MBU2887657.1 bifunctional hydroxymethylpyrimidine kinase/phosphomethylpyrimidine kinase [Gilvimarinus agarilyticus]MDO6572306.1 bifunctional hydroxymethylpyrimidine kinase/phosphomethylpyrimidine kinase [Gilvimarinus sp. 2_MG-2023]MDO6746478.1 bifunctional hydroxymethylpyrimidine kinase/phosphomethylpyrimidine kinase [Gilvimarinus sp. 1_MG-2023]